MNIGLDLDGTLLNSKFRHIIALYDCLNDKSLEFSNLEDLISYKSEDNDTLSYLYKKGFSSPNDIYKCWLSNIESEKYLKYDVLYEDSVFFLERASIDHKLFLVTSRRNGEGVIKQLKTLKIHSYFEKIFISGSMNKKSFFTKDIELKIIIGDSEEDLVWAQDMKCKFVPVNRGFRAEKWWDSRGLKSYGNLLEVLDFLRKGRG